MREDHRADIGEALAQVVVLEALVGGPDVRPKPVGTFVGCLLPAQSSSSGPRPGPLQARSTGPCGHGGWLGRLLRFDMWEQSLLTSSGQVEALRLLSEWWDSSRCSRPPWGRRGKLTAPGGTVADVLVLPPATGRRIWTSGWRG